MDELPLPEPRWPEDGPFSPIDDAYSADQMRAYAAAAVAAERAKIADMCGNMAAVSWAEWDEKADPTDQGKALALEHVAALLEGKPVE